MSSSFGTLFHISTFGESHGKGVGVIVDGFPPGIQLSEADIQPQLDRRRPGQSKLTTDRQEADRVTIFSGVENGVTLGTPIGLFVPNKDQRPGDYRDMRQIPRPSHADFTYQMKYGVRALSGAKRALRVVGDYTLLGIEHLASGLDHLLFVTGLLLLVSGGLCCSLGLVFCAWRRLPYGHAVWHLFVLAGSACHYLCILFYV